MFIVVVAVIVAVSERGWRGSCRLRGIIKNWASETNGFVEDEVIKLIMLEVY